MRATSFWGESSDDSLNGIMSVVDMENIFPFWIYPRYYPHTLIGIMMVLLGSEFAIHVFQEILQGYKMFDGEVTL